MSRFIFTMWFQRYDICHTGTSQQLEYGEKLISKNETFIHFRFITFFILRIRAYSSWKSKIRISKYYNIYIWVSINDHPYSIHFGYLLFFETTIMGKTADLAMVQKTIIDTLHKEGKSQRVITERGGCSRSAVSKHIKSKVDEGINWVGRCAQATGMTASLRILSNKVPLSRIQFLSSFTISSCFKTIWILWKSMGSKEVVLNPIDFNTL